MALIQQNEHTGMKMTEVGWIPKDWEVKTLEDIGNFSKGRGVSRDQSHSGNLPCVRYGELYTSHDNYIRNFYSFISQEVADTAKRLNKGDVLFAASGETKEEIGKAVAFVGNEEAYAGGDIIILSPKIESDSMFLGFALNGEESVRQKSALGQGDAVVHIHVPELSKVSIPFPSPSEQRRIAQVLSDTDSLIASLSRTIEKKRLVKQGAMQQLLTGKTRLKGFSGEWVEKELGEVLKYEQPQEYLVHDTEYIETGIPVLTAGKTFILGYTYEQDGVYDKLPCILFDDFTTASRFVNFKFKVKSSAAKILTLRNKMDDLRLIYELMQLIDFPLQDHQRYWISEFSHLTIRIPDDPNEQFAISERLRTMDNEIASLEAELQKYKFLKQGMMQKLLTGQIRLK